MNGKLLASLVIAALCMPALSFAQEKKGVTATVKEKTETVKDNIKESIITTKIKAEYAKDKEVSFRHIHVDTDDRNVVTLSGNAKSKAEMNKAVAIAKKTEGVAKVINHIKVAKKPS